MRKKPMNETLRHSAFRFNESDTFESTQAVHTKPDSDATFTDCRD